MLWSVLLSHGLFEPEVAVPSRRGTQVTDKLRRSRYTLSNPNAAVYSPVEHFIRV